MRGFLSKAADDVEEAIIEGSRGRRSKVSKEEGRGRTKLQSLK